MRFNNLNDWLAWQSSLHPKNIELGLGRVNDVYQRMAIAKPAPKIVTVAGTNGKGSCVAALEAIYSAAGYRVGSYTSPHLIHYNERVKLQREAVSDDELCRAFEAVDRARGEISLTYFEFGTLAAFYLFSQADLDIVILETGLGGRLDAVNIIDTDVALITNVALDHMDWLGTDRDQIGVEKAGIARQGKPCIVAELNPPEAMLITLRDRGVNLSLLGHDFAYTTQENSWTWQASDGQVRRTLPWPALRGPQQLQNMSGVLQVVRELEEPLPVTQADVRAGLLDLRLPGRFQVIQKNHSWILDVAHNPHAAAALATNLSLQTCPGDTHAIVGMLSDKDIKSVFAALEKQVDRWHFIDINEPRGATAEQLKSTLLSLDPVQGAQTYPSIAVAIQRVNEQLGTHDRVVIFGSFYTVGDAIKLLG